MGERDDSVSGSSPCPATAFLSNTEMFVNEDELWLDMIGPASTFVGDSNENQGDHDPPDPLQNLEGTSILDREWGWLYSEPQPAGTTTTKNNYNYNPSDCWSAASEAPSLNSFLPAAASDAASPAALNLETVEAENGNLATMINHQEMHQSLCKRLLPSCNSHLLSLEGDEEDSLSIESDEDDSVSVSQSTVHLTEEISQVHSQTPELGLVFSSEDEAYKFYKTYAKEIGFRVRKAKVRRLSNGMIRKRFVYCSREGFRAKNQSSVNTAKYQRKETRTGCDARVEFTVENAKWVISGFNPVHNHDLEGKTKFIETPGDRSMSITMNKAGMLNEARVPKTSGFHCIDSSCFSHDEKTNPPLQVDGQNLINYFMFLQREDPSFSYNVQVSAENCLTDFFWTDCRSRMDYDYFGDVVIAGTPFRIDAYDMVYVPFSGLNHQGRCVLFGGAFLHDDGKDSFIWLLRTFLDSMGGRQPITIFTDAHQAMADAIDVVLPKTHHLLGIWCILQKAKSILSKCYGQPSFNTLFKKCIFDCESDEEFESIWGSLLEKYDLSANSWLKTLYMLRRKWSQCFCGSIFSAGIRSNKHCHSISHFFHSLTSNATTPSQYLQQYLRVAEKQQKEELFEDFRCNGSAPATILRSNALENEAAKVYSITMFKLFQEELLGCLSVAVEEIPGDGMTAKFRVTEEGQKEKIVEFNCEESHIRCSCKKYESVGILCVHALKVLNAKNIFHIPPQYIMKRWTRSAKDGIVAVGQEGEVADDSQRHSRLRKSKLMCKALHVISKSLAIEETEVIADDYLNIILKKVEDVLRTKNIAHLNTTAVDVSCKDDENEIISVETQQMESNPSTFNQMKASGQRTRSHLKRKHESEKMVPSPVTIP